MKTKLFTLLMLLPVFGWGQLRVITHPILGHKTVATKWFTFINKPKRFDIDARMIRENGGYFLQLKIDGQAITHLVSPGMALGFFEKGKRVIALICDDGTQSRYENDLIKYPITEEQIKTITSHEIDEVKMEYDKGFMDDKITKPYREDLYDALRSISGEAGYVTQDVKISKGIWLRYVSLKGAPHIEIKTANMPLAMNNRLNFYNGDDKQSFYADSVHNEDPPSAGRNYSYAYFPVDKNAAGFLNAASFSKASLQGKYDKVVINEVMNKEELKKFTNNAYTIWFEK